MSPERPFPGKSAGEGDASWDNFPWIYSKNDISIKGKYSKDLNLDISSDSDLYDFDEIDNYTLLELDKKDEKDNEINIKKNRTHSFTILEMLQKKVEKNEE